MSVCLGGELTHTHENVDFDDENIERDGDEEVTDEEQYLYSSLLLRDSFDASMAGPGTGSRPHSSRTHPPSGRVLERTRNCRS